MPSNATANTNDFLITLIIPPGDCNGKRGAVKAGAIY
jgi:hypothetical protein